MIDFLATLYTDLLIILSLLYVSCLIVLIPTWCGWVIYRIIIHFKRNR